jgi:hypothetical protein
MDARISVKTTFLAAAISLALAASAYAAPAGDEYLPKVPKASGNSASHNQGSGASVNAASSAGSTTTETQASSTSAASNSSSTGGGGTKSRKQGGNQRNPAPAPVTAVPASSSDDSSDSTLLSPVIILLVAGVILGAVGMTLRRRNTGANTPGEEPGSGRHGAGQTPPTPDGEIVAGGDRTR